MYLFLFAFGAVLSVAGLILAASGLSVHDHTFDVSLVTPGIVAVVGGLLLIGLGFALRVLQRIEHALEARPVMPRPARTGVPLEPAVASAPAAEPSAEPSRVPFPVRITRPPQTAANPPPTLPLNSPPPAMPTPAVERQVDELPQKFPSVARLGPAPVAETEEAPPKLPSSATAADAEETERAGPFVPRVFKGRNGAAPPPRVSPRLDPSARAPLRPQRPIGPAFDALWPKGGRRAAAQAQPAPESSPNEPVAEERAAERGAPPERGAPQQRPAPRDRVSAPEQVAPEEQADQEQSFAPSSTVAPDVAPEEAPVPISILKSGVVDGMAYTLYSDGSIEAQLPQGTLRFGSITELRAHIEQDTQG
jgi:hypothetical protein